jgi:hypothetical protein
MIERRSGRRAGARGQDRGEASRPPAWIAVLDATRGQSYLPTATRKEAQPRQRFDEGSAPSACNDPTTAAEVVLRVEKGVKLLFALATHQTSPTGLVPELNLAYRPFHVLYFERPSRLLPAVFSFVQGRTQMRRGPETPER